MHMLKQKPYKGAKCRKMENQQPNLRIGEGSTTIIGVSLNLSYLIIEILKKYDLYNLDVSIKKFR